MLISEFIVGLWFVPVVLFIAIPLTVLCAWTVHRLLRTAFDKVEQAASSARAPSFRHRPAV